MLFFQVEILWLFLKWPQHYNMGNTAFVHIFMKAVHCTKIALRSFSTRTVIESVTDYKTQTHTRTDMLTHTADWSQSELKLSCAGVPQFHTQPSRPCLLTLLHSECVQTYCRPQVHVSTGHRADLLRSPAGCIWFARLRRYLKRTLLSKNDKMTYHHMITRAGWQHKMSKRWLTVPQDMLFPWWGHGP